MIPFCTAGVLTIYAFLPFHKGLQPLQVCVQAEHDARIDYAVTQVYRPVVAAPVTLVYQPAYRGK